MDIKVGTLVACDLYEMDQGKISPPDQKRGFGVVLSETPRHGMPWETGRSFQTRLIYPPNVQGIVLGILEKDMVGLAQDCVIIDTANLIPSKLPDILLALIRRIERLEGENRFLKESAKAL